MTGFGKSFPRTICRSLIIGCFVLTCLRTAAQPVFDFNDECRRAYQQIIMLRLDRGQKILDSEKRKHPDNLIPIYLENYIDFFILFFNEDPAEFKLRASNGEKRLKLIDHGPSNSPLYLFTKSIIHFQWAAVNVKFGNNWEAGWEFRRSFLESKSNLRKFGDFSPNDMLYGPMQVAAGTIPDGYKWLGNLLGIKGSIREGMTKLELFLNQKNEWALLFHDEAVFYYLYLKFYIENKKDDVFRFINDEHLDVRNNHLFTYLAANLGINDQQAAYTIKVLSQKSEGPEYLIMPAWDMEMGYAKLDGMEPDAAVYLNRFVNNFQGRFYMKDVLQKLSWFYYLENDQKRAESVRKMILQKGSAETESEKQAQQEALSGYWPDKTLLRARLLNDGGYHRKALQQLEGKTEADFNRPADKLEFSYRLGRIYDDLNRKDEAIAKYLLTLSEGADAPQYFAARSALQIGYIYEAKGDKSQAISYYQQCLDLKDHEYKNSLDQKAKAGIARCSE
ncbi:MAG TPA: tetratricopeptide repeat protein [Puia sp.]|nr:tetratricopeptide repeat protein [Puia sp.]